MGVVLGLIMSCALCSGVCALLTILARCRPRPEATVAQYVVRAPGSADIAAWASIIGAEDRLGPALCAACAREGVVTATVTRRGVLTLVATGIAPLSGLSRALCAALFGENPRAGDRWHDGERGSAIAEVLNTARASATADTLARGWRVRRRMRGASLRVAIAVSLAVASLVLASVALQLSVNQRAPRVSIITLAGRAELGILVCVLFSVLSLLIVLIAARSQVQIAAATTLLVERWRAAEPEFLGGPGEGPDGALALAFLLREEQRWCAAQSPAIETVRWWKESHSTAAELVAHVRGFGDQR